MEYNNEKASVAPLVLGLTSFLGTLIAIVGIVLGIVGIVYSLKDKKKSNSRYGNVGLILSIIGLSLSVINSILGVIMVLGSIL